MADSSNSTNAPEENETTSTSISFSRLAMIGSIVFVLLYLAIFGVGLGLAVWQGQSFMNWMAYIQNLLTIALSLSLMVIVIGIGILIIQIARFVNLLRSEIKPITDDTKAAFQNLRNTSEFMQKHGVEPIIRSQSFLAGLVAFLREIVRLAQVFQRAKPRD